MVSWEGTDVTINHLVIINEMYTSKLRIDKGNINGAENYRFCPNVVLDNSRVINNEMKILINSCVVFIQEKLFCLKLT